MIMFRAESKVVVMLGGCLNNDVHLCLDVTAKVTFTSHLQTLMALFPKSKVLKGLVSRSV